MQDTSLVLRDIHDLDAIPWWPLAPGWWWVIGLVVLILLVAGVRYWIRYSGVIPGWRGDARRQLRTLKKALRKDDPRDVAGRLSILLRRIAMARGGRRQAAGLSGDNWLAWLEQNDSSDFSWMQHGQVLTQAPYMPPVMAVNRDEVMRLVVAAMRWNDSTPATRSTQGVRWLQKTRALLTRKANGATGV
jgi:hypothetical protein